MRALKRILVLVFCVAATNMLSAQYFGTFGQNKPNYESFEYEVEQTPHFEIYHYLNNPERLKELASQSEHWYHMHQRVLNDTIQGKNPLIFYNDHADFQQTNAISGAIGVGTGGVTEAFKNRVIMPIAMSNQQTHHVLGHELVHAFQYNMIINGDSTSLRNLSNLPLWLVEGLAEYMSIGSVDAHTAMWMRDAVLNDDVPTIKKLDNPKYFPYRYGQAFWAFLTGLKGDDIIEPFFTSVAKYGFDEACKMELGMSKENLSELWVNTIKKHFGETMNDTTENFVGKQLVSKDNGGRINISPMISPSGRYVAFLSERDLFSIDIFLADARTGEVIRKIASASKEGHIDDYSYIESAGTWSPNSKEFAFVAISKGQNILVIKEALTGKTIKELVIEDLPAFTNPAWSPDGKSIVVTGLVEGQVDLYSVNVKTGRVEQLTDDVYSEMHPFWADDGSSILFSTDQLSVQRGRVNGQWTFNLASLDPVSGVIEHYDIFPGADNLNPVQDTSGNILFLSNRDGFRNMYKYEVETGKVYQMTNFLTGITGITPFAPAMSIERRRSRVIFSHFSKNEYTIYRARPEDLTPVEVDPNDVDFTAAQLPRVNKRATSLVDGQLNQMDQMASLEASEIESVPFKSKFKLDYASGSTGIGIGTSNTFGTTTGLAGGVDLLFSDIVGNHQLLTSISLNGEITDFGGAVAYINRQSRISWGAQLSHIPFRSVDFRGRFLDTLQVSEDLGILTDHWVLDLTRVFEDRAGVFAQYPFSKSLRVEAGASFSRYSSRTERIDNYYDEFGRLIAQEREKIDPAFPGFNLWNVQAALVGDNSSFGFTAPIRGQRYRLGVERVMGEFDYTAATADYRKYTFIRPISLAFRALHYGRYGGQSDELFPIYVGSPWYVRGYNSNTAEDILARNGKSFNQLLGSKMLVSNFEVRVPFTGPEQLALIKSKFLLTDLNFFVDGGVAFYDVDQLSGPTYQLDANGNPIIGEDGNPLTLRGQARPLFSAGASVRVNLFGAMILEPYYAFPLMKETRGVFGLNIIPGW